MRKILSLLMALLLLTTTGTSTIFATATADEEITSMVTKTFDKGVMEDVSSAYQGTEVEKKIIDGLENYDISIDISEYEIPKTEFSKLIFEVFYNHPELFYVSTTNVRYSMDATGAVNVYYPTYTVEKSDCPARIAEFNSNVNEILKSANNVNGDINKALVMLSKLTAICSYDLTAENCYTAYGCIVDRKAVCQGYAMPIQYSGITEEHVSVRERAGIFDVSHMGEIQVKGKDALEFLEYLCTNNISSLKDNEIIYTFFCRENGFVVDDLLVYRFNEEEFFLVVNASNSDKDYEWILENKGNFDVEVENISDTIGEIAIQGPKAQEILQKLTDYDLSEIKFFHLRRDVNVAGVNCLISRTGYTGEDGFEVYCPWEEIVKVWDAILEEGKDINLLPCGLGCRDTLRFEAGLPLYGHEISEDVNPLEGGFKFFVDLDKPQDFIGKETLTKQYESGLKRILCGLELVDKGIMREEYEVYKDDVKIGYVTTGYKSPTLGKSIANALLDSEYKDLDTEVYVKIRNKMAKAKVISKRFLSKRTKSK